MIITQTHTLINKKKKFLSHPQKAPSIRIPPQGTIPKNKTKSCKKKTEYKAKFLNQNPTTKIYRN